MSDKWSPISGASVTVTEEEKRFIVEVQETGKDTMVLGIAKDDFKTEDGKVFIRSGAKVEILNTACAIAPAPKSPAP